MSFQGGDFKSVVWLLVLYTLQGVPLGMSAVFPLMLKERGASYSDLARFSMCSWPFALKLLWAPLVDGWSFSSIGRRKSWLVPIQFAIAFLLYWLSTQYESLLQSGQIEYLTFIFFCLYFLAATQDIVVDGWALTMLSNVAHAGTCNSVGQTAGYFLAFSGFFGLSRLNICSLAVYMQIWAGIFFIVTLIVAFLVPEKRETNTPVFAIYKEMHQVIMLKPVVLLCVILLSTSVSFIDSLLGVKFQDSGVSPDIIALLATLTTPVHILLPWLVSKFAPKSSPLQSFRKMYPVRLFFQIVSVVLILFTPYALSADSGVALAAFYALCLLLSIVESGVVQIMFMSQMSFFAKVSDPVIGGTYMTVLNTISNIGGNVAKQISYRLAEATTNAHMDGFYVVVAFVTIYGIVWIKYFGKKLVALERMPKSAWRVANVPKK